MSMAVIPEPTPEQLARSYERGRQLGKDLHALGGPDSIRKVLDQMDRYPATPMAAESIRGTRSVLDELDGGKQ